MPIYEFYCSDCHTIYSFLSRAINTRKRPACPRCSRPRLERRASAFAISTGRSEPSPDAELPEGFDEAGFERAMAGLADQAEGVDEEDPRAVARVMRRFFEGAGLRMGEGMEEALHRMEAGEDPDAVEEDMGELLGDDEQLFTPGKKTLRALRRTLPPRIDRTLHEM